VESAPTRYISSFIIEFISNFHCFCIHKYALSPDEIAMICLIAEESTREIRKDAYLSRNYGQEDRAIPNSHRSPVSARQVYTRLLMKRETTRRKLEQLAKQNFLQKVKGGYILPSQTGEDDYTKDLREFMIDGLANLQRYIEKMPA
jgi:hypothetical protein